MANLKTIADALENGFPLRTVLAVALDAADRVLADQAEAIGVTSRARAALVLREAGLADVQAEKVRVAAALTRSAYETGRNDGERKALATEALAQSEGYARLAQVEREQVQQLGDAGATVEAAKEALRLEQARLAVVNNALDALAAIAHLARTEAAEAGNG